MMHRAEYYALLKSLISKGFNVYSPLVERDADGAPRVNEQTLAKWDAEQESRRPGWNAGGRGLIIIEPFVGLRD